MWIDEFLKFKLFYFFVLRVVSSMLINLLVLFVLWELEW
jgi:hypothetical protein